MFQKAKPVIIGSIAALVVGGSLIARAEIGNNQVDPTPSPIVASDSPTPVATVVPTDTPSPTDTPVSTPEPTADPTPSVTPSPVPTPAYTLNTGDDYSYEYPSDCKSPSLQLVACPDSSYVITESTSDFLTQLGDDVSTYREITVSGKDAYESTIKLNTVVETGNGSILIQGRQGTSISSWPSTNMSDPDYQHLLDTFTLK